MNIRTYALGFAIIGMPFLAVGCSKQETANAAGQSLTIVLKTDQRIEQGETDDVLVTIKRDDFEGAVNVEFSELPDGIRVLDPGPIGRDDTSRTYRLSATEVAPRVEDHRVRVTASAKGLNVSETFKLTVVGE